LIGSMRISDAAFGSVSAGGAGGAGGAGITGAAVAQQLELFA
jgi:hypothetical protein